MEPWRALAVRRRQLSMTQAELGGTVVSQSMISQIEKGVVRPSVETLLALAERMGDDGEAWVVLWYGRTQRAMLEDHLWTFVVTRDRIGLRLALGLMDEGNPMPPASSDLVELPRYTHLFFTAFALAEAGELRRATHALLLAWEDAGAPDLPLDAVSEYPVSRMNAPGVECTRMRCLVLDGMTHWTMAHAIGRRAVETYWRGRVRDRLEEYQRIDARSIGYHAWEKLYWNR